jgi:signal transduction histidine kinase
VTGTAIRGGDGEIVGYEGIIKDITARMDALRDLQKRHRELSLLNSVALSMNMTQNLDEVLSTALENVLDVLSLSSGGIFIIDHKEETFSLRVHRGLPGCVIDSSFSLRFHDRDLMKALLNEDMALTPEPTFPPFAVELDAKNGADTLHFSCFLITAKEKASGFIALVPEQDRVLTEQDLHLLGSLGNFLGGAVENSQLLRTINNHREDLKRLTAKLFHTQETERKRIARELHDEAGQALTGINFSLETIEKNLPEGDLDVKEMIGEIKNQLNRTYQEMRRISYRLHPALLTDLGLEPALDAYLANISKHSDLEIHFRMVGFENRIDPDLETLLYRLSQEALTNTLKHAKAENFHLSIIRSFPNIIFVAEDDGIGFDASSIDQHKHALGLVSMRERAAMAGGKFLLRAAPGAGTRIRIEISIREGANGR